jgi:micrococcal nuclease
MATLLVGAALLAPPAAAARLPAFEAGETATVSAVLDGGAVTLADGRTVALVGIVLPHGRQPFADKARAALEKLVLGQAVELRYAGNRRDRYGRVLAHLFLGRRWVQGELLRRGLARVASTADNRRGVAEMLAREDAARRARRGLWRDPFYAIRRAEEAGRYSETFQIVEGRAVGMARVDGALLLNFAEDWRHAFTARLTPEALKLFRADGIDPAALLGERLRLRGFIQGSERPTIDITHPEQIEKL